MLQIDKTSPIDVMFGLILIKKILAIHWCYIYEGKVKITENEIFSFVCLFFSVAV